MADLVTTAQLNSLKLKFAKCNSAELSELDRETKQRKFSAWCLSIIGEQVDYQDPAAWCREWFDTCWKHLIDSDVPFDA
jgi:hypothetical protein